MRAKRLHLESTDGVVVTRVRTGLPAKAAGLQINDVVVAADGEPLGNEDAINAALDRVPAGGHLRLTILRAGGTPRDRSQARLLESFRL